MAYYIAYRHALIIYFIRFCTEIAVKIDFINKTLKIMNNEFNILSENVIIGTISLQNIIRYILSPWQLRSRNDISQIMENRISPMNLLTNGPSMTRFVYIVHISNIKVLKSLNLCLSAVYLVKIEKMIKKFESYYFCSKCF